MILRPSILMLGVSRSERVCVAIVDGQRPTESRAGLMLSL